MFWESTFTRTMAALDLSEMDVSILKYTQWVTSIFQTRQLKLHHGNDSRKITLYTYFLFTIRLNGKYEIGCIQQT